MPTPWQESLLDEGYEDMAKVMKALTDVGFDGCAIPDHIPGFVADGAGLACESHAAAIVFGGWRV